MRSAARRGDVDDLRRRLGTLRPAAPPRWGRMSAHQMVCHAADAMRMAIAERPVTAAPGLVPRTLLKWIALYAPLRWPRGIPTSPEIDQECDGTAPAEFARDVAQVEMLLHRMATETTAFAPHPLFGRMSRSQWLRWAYLHLDHHLRQFGV